MKKVVWFGLMVLFFVPVFCVAQPSAKRAPDFTLQNKEGKKVSLSDFSEKVIYIDFWATWCKPCMEEIPGSIQLAKKMSSDTTIVFMAISIDGDRDKWQSVIEKKKMPGIQLISLEGKESDVLINYQVEMIPRFIIVDKKGRIAVNDAPSPREAETEKLLQEISRQE